MLPPMPVEPLVLAVLVVLAFLAGLVDAIAGGGGLLQLPPLLAFVGPGYALGTNKTASIFGTTAALVRYARHGAVRWAARRARGPRRVPRQPRGVPRLPGLREAARPAPSSPRSRCNSLVLAVDQVRAARVHPKAPATTPARPRIGLGLAFAAAIALYDGIVGPGTGIFLFWAFTTWFALSPLEATARARRRPSTC